MTVISSKCKIYARPADSDDGELKQIGVTATFDPSESRNINAVRGIGFGDHVAELVPGLTEPLTLSITRTAQYVSQVYQVFGYKGGIDGIVRSLRHHKWPFDIVQEIIISALDPVVGEVGEQSEYVGESSDPFDPGLAAILTTYEGCWFNSYGTSFAAETAIVTENVSITCTDVIAGSTAEYSETSEELFQEGAKSRILTSVAQGVNV
jgi:hypothetical protein